MTEAPKATRRGTPALGSALKRLSREAAMLAGIKVDSWTRHLQESAQPLGAAEQAVVSGVEAAVANSQNPVWAAAKGAWGAADVKTRAVMVSICLLLAVIAPVLLLLLLIALLVLVTITRAKRGAAA